MKVALYIEDGTEQIVLTAETDTEKMVLEKFETSSRTFDIYRGEFYDCRGGWIRHERRGMYDGPATRHNTDSVIIRFRPIKETPNDREEN